MLRPDRVAELAAQLKRDGQLHASPVVTRAAYLKLYPEDVDLIGNARWVQGPGARRRAAQLLNGSPVIKVEIQNDIAASRDKWLEVTLSENIDRENLDPIEEALAVQQLVQEAGSAAEVARRRKRSDAWVFQKLNLLKLHADVQAQLRADGDARLPVREVRNWHMKPESYQLAKLAAWRRRNDPTYVNEGAPSEAEAEPGGEGPARPSRFRGTFDKMGKTPAERAHALVVELTDEECAALRRELGG